MCPSAEAAARRRGLIKNKEDSLNFSPLSEIWARTRPQRRSLERVCHHIWRFRAAVGGRGGGGGVGGGGRGEEGVSFTAAPALGAFRPRWSQLGGGAVGGAREPMQVENVCGFLWEPYGDKLSLDMWKLDCNRTNTWLYRNDR